MEKVRTISFVKQSTMVALTAPIIYSMIIPALILDLFVSAYQSICFPVYGIQKVNREKYIVMDRHKLSYLNSMQKLNCLYCGYFNGLIGYVREIAARTEQYWCPIKHLTRREGSHSKYKNFADYGDEKNFRKKYN